MTLAQIRARFRMDPLFNSTTVISVADADILILEGALDLAKRGHALPIKATWSGVASAARYVLSGAAPKVTRFLDVFWESGGLFYTLAGVTYTQPNDFEIRSEIWLDLNFPNWRDDTASNTLDHAFLEFDSSGNLTLGVHPKTSTTAPTFSLYYLSGGTDMTDATHYPWVTGTQLAHLEPFHKYISEYALWQANELILKNQVQAEKHMQKYLSGALGMKASQDKLFLAEIAGTMAAEAKRSQQTFGRL